MWLISSILVGVLAAAAADPVFILLQASTLASAAAILFLAHRYRGMVCDLHAQRYLAALASNAREHHEPRADTGDSSGAVTKDATAQ